MELVPYKYSQVLPASFSNSFIEYLNSDIKGSLIVIKDGEILLPLLVRKKMIFKIGYFVHIPLKNGKRLTLNEEKDFFESLTYFLKKNKLLDFILPPLHLDNFNHIPRNAKGYQIGIISLALDNKTTDEIFESFKPVYRRHIKNAEKANVEIKFGLEYFDDFYSVYSEKLKRENGVLDSYDKIKKLAFNKDSEINIQCGVAYLGNKIEAGLLNINDRTNSFYIFGAASSNAHNGSFRLLHWEFIKKYKVAGLSFYKLGAARNAEMLTEKHERLASFKMGFGANIQEGYHFIFKVSYIKYWLYAKLILLKNIVKA